MFTATLCACLLIHSLPIPEVIPMDEGWVCVESSSGQQKIRDAELVLTAVGIESRVERSLFGWRLFVVDTFASTAQRQLEAYRRENARRPKPIPANVTLETGYVGVAGYFAVIWTIYLLEFVGVLDGIKSAGALYRPAVVNGEWWLTITALTLHSDFVHIASNSVFGGLFGLIAGRTYGSGFAWLLIVVCGGAANFLNAAVSPGSPPAIGASTAAFAAAGLVAGQSWRVNYRSGAGFRFNYLPIAAAIAIFVFAGIGGDNVDVMGHLLGLFVGVVVGVGIGTMDYRRLGRSGQMLSFALCSLLILFSWSLT